MSEQRRCYEILGLEPGASPERVKQAYRDLVQVWHPDRFEHDPRLQEKAQEKLKEINEAYGKLTNTNSGTRVRKTKRHAKQYVGAQRREHFRVEYPSRYRPKLIIAESEYDILDLSESGVRFSCSNGKVLEHKIHATITFHDGEALKIEGEVFRSGDNEMALRLVKRVPLRRIVKEQRHLMNELWVYGT
ncbi:MAG: DnaJ domain-containing protein [bacterium]|nr:J domain-containing protein [bacterium]